MSIQRESIQYPKYPNYPISFTLAPSDVPIKNSEHVLAVLGNPAAIICKEVPPTQSQKTCPTCVIL